MLAVYFFKIASWLSYKLPDWFKYPLAALGGEIYYWVARKHSAYADRNMQIVLGEPDINRRVRSLARRSFRNYARYMLEFFSMTYLQERDVASISGTCGWEHIEKSIKTGRGTMMVTGHFGNWDIAAVLVCNSGFKLSSVANDFKPPELNALIQGVRRKFGIRIYSPKDALRGLYTSLKNNEIVVLLLDSPVEGDGVIVDFFGRPAKFPSGPAMLASRTGSDVMAGFLARQPGKKAFYGMWEPPIKYQYSGNRETDVQNITQAFANALEKVVRRHPDQWYMFRKIWLEDDEIAEYNQRVAEGKNGRKGKANEVKARSETVSPNISNGSKADS